MSLDEMTKVFGGKIRVRVMGILIENDKILMLNHKGMNKTDELWLPPGGGVEYQETIKDALIREFKEEVGLDITVGNFLTVNELITERFHTYEFFFKVLKKEGEIKLGYDPELETFQPIQGFKFLSIEDIQSKGKDKVHGVFHNLSDFYDLAQNQGIFY
ncbi:NUDIX domain-containing protein [Reichenbachiella versicolor]|uniref:NUDIX domain-containing protein n=1 Tax=Reichenbachiella versicolor TaxID=1821036 RepID=UPI000D6DD897|nr:NUDIX domain-containing protein [Reichenbachiella versicolor]